MIDSHFFKKGVGKNKLCDSFLERLKLPRQYIQLHRDTTVQTLTLQPSLQSGKLGNRYLILI